MRSSELFLELVLRFSDLRWLEFRDDLLIKCVKVLRRLSEGSDPEEVREDPLSAGVEEVLDLLESFARNADSAEVEGLMDALRIFVKSPAPCKVKIISVMESLTERKRG